MWGKVAALDGATGKATRIVAGRAGLSRTARGGVGARPAQSRVGWVAYPVWVAVGQDSI